MLGHKRAAKSPLVQEIIDTLVTDLQVFPWFSVIELMSKITKIYLAVAQQLTICCQRSR